MAKLCSFIFLGLLSLAVSKEPTIEDYSLISPFATVNEDATLDAPGLLKKYGYPSETHQVQTDDGYILTIHRIPYGRKCGPEKGKRPPVLLQHGLLCSSVDWIVMGTEKGLGYILADECYDVWMTNYRGNTQGRKHIHLKPEQLEFWDFSWHQMGVYDIPAMIDYILHATEAETLHFAGHSQGTTGFFVMGSERPEYTKKVRLMQALAPVAYMTNLASPLVRFAAKFQDPIEDLMDFFGVGEFLPTTKFLSTVGGDLCTDEHPTLQALCANVLFILCGFDSKELNATMLPAIVGHTPAGAAVKQIYHYGQGVNNDGHFRQYDFGWWENLKKYGSLSPPDYDLSRIECPVAFHYSQNDWMANEEDVLKALAQIPNPYDVNRIQFKDFNHLDFMWAIRGRELVWDRMIKNMKDIDATYK